MDDPNQDDNGYDQEAQEPVVPNEDEHESDTNS
jgi:hypothetical protein